MRCYSAFQQGCPALTTVHVCLVDLCLKMPLIPPSFLSSASIPLDTALICQGSLNATKYQIGDVSSDCGVRHFL
jgi:hypothetical protein